MIRIYYDGQEIQFNPDELPGFSYALQELIDISAIKGEVSTTMRLPATAQVRSAMGGPSLAEYTETEDSAFVIEVGGATVFKGVARVISRSSDEYQVIAVGGNGAWKDGAHKLRLRSMDLGVTDDVTFDYIYDDWTAGLDEDRIDVYPLASYGQLRTQDNTFDVPLSYLRPGLRVYKLLKEGFARIGYSIAAEGGLAQTWKKFILPNSTPDVFSVNTDGGDALTTYRTGETDYVHNISGPSDPIPDNVQMPLYVGNFFTAPGRFTPPSDGYAKAHGRANFHIDNWQGAVNGAGIYFYDMTFVVFDFTDNLVVASVTRHYNAQQGNYNSATVNDPTINFGTFAVTGSHQYGIGMYSPQYLDIYGGSGGLGFTQSAVRIFDEFNIVWTLDYQSFVNDKPLIIASASPDITLLELLKWFCTSQGIVVQTDELTHHITLKYYDDFARPIAEGLDMSDRLDHTDPPRKVTDILPKQYQFRFTEDGNDLEVQVTNRTRVGIAPYGGHDYDVPGGKDSPQTIDVGFAPTAMGTILGGACIVPLFHANSTDIDNNGNIDNLYDWEPRLLYMDGILQTSFTLDSTLVDTYPRTYFVWPEQGRIPVGFGDEQGQAGTVNTRLRNRLRRFTSPTLEGSLRIYDHELIDIDFGVPIYLSDGEHGSWFYFLSIDRHQFTKDQTTEVKLLRM